MQSQEHWKPHGHQWPGGTKIVQTTKPCCPELSAGKTGSHLTLQQYQISQICLHIDQLFLSGRRRKNVKSHEQFYKNLTIQKMINNLNSFNHWACLHWNRPKNYFTSSAYGSFYQNKAIITLYCLKPCFGLQK